MPVLSGFPSDSSQALGKNALNGLCGQLQIFLRYLYLEGRVPNDLSRGIDCPLIYRLPDIPRAIPWEERRLLEAIDRRSRVGKRDYAILLLLVTCGLRAREIAAGNARSLSPACTTPALHIPLNLSGDGPVRYPRWIRTALPIPNSPKLPNKPPPGSAYKNAGQVRLVPTGAGKGP